MNIQKSGRILLLIYLLILVWILLFKFAVSWREFTYILHNGRSINLVPFQGSTIINGKIGLLEIGYNFLIFIPFGVLLGIVDKNHTFLGKCLLIASFSLAIEVLQFVLGVGASDVTDLLMNTAGGVVGLLSYLLLRRLFPDTKLDSWLILLGSLLFILSLGFVLFVLIYNALY